MALDSTLTQNINLRANGDALLRPLQAMGNQLNRLVQQMQQVANPSTSAGRKQLEQLTQQANKTLGTIKTLNDLIQNGSKSGRRKNALLGGLDEQSLGKTVLNASKLKTALQDTTKASDALEVRLAQLYKKFNDLGNAGKAIKSNDINKALNTQQALKDVRQLEMQISRLDARYKAKGGLSENGQALREKIQLSQDSLLSRVQNGRRVDWTKEIAGLQLYYEQYRDLEKAEAKAAAEAKKAADKATADAEKAASAKIAEEKKAADATAREAKRAADAKIRENERAAKADADAAEKRRAAAIEMANLNEAQLRNSLTRGAGKFTYTPEQAKNFNVGALNNQITEGVRRLQQFQVAMNKAVEQGRSQAVLDRLATSFKRISTETSEAIAQVRTFDALPQNKRGNLLQSFFGSMDSIKSTVGIVAGFNLINTAVSSVMGTIQGGIQFITQFDDAMAQLQAISGATDVEMQKVGQTILDLGANSKYSTVEIAQAATQIAQAGYSAQESGQVLESALNLAAGSGSTVAEAVDTMTSSLGAFQLQASESAHIADVLMSGLNESKLSIQQMQAALQYAGSTAHEAGASFEELVAIASSLANAGIKSGSTIGTGVRQLYVDLLTPTEKFKAELKSLGLTMGDVNVKAKGMAEVVRTLTNAGFSAEQAYNGFEVRAAAAFLAFRNQIDTYDELAQSLQNTGAAAEAAAHANESIAAKWQMLKNTLGELVTLLSTPLKNSMKVILDLLTGLTSTLVGAIKGVGEFASIVSQAMGVSDAWAGVLGNALLPALMGFAVGGPMGAVIGGILGLIGGLTDAADASDELKAKTDASEEAMKSSKQTVTSVDDAMNRLIERSELLKTNHVALQTEVLDLTGKFEGLASQLDMTKLSYEGLIAAMIKFRGVELQKQAAEATETKLNVVNQARPVFGQLAANAQALSTQANNARGPNGLRGYQNAPALIAVQQYANGVVGKNYTNVSGSNLLSESVTLQRLINGVRELGEGNAYLDAIIENLRTRKNKVDQIMGFRGKYDTATMTENLAKVLSSPEAQSRDQFLADIKGGVTEAQNMNLAQAGSGNAKLAAVLERAKAQLAIYRKALSGKGENSPEGLALNQAISDLTQEINAAQAAGATDKQEKSKPWRALLSPEVKAALEKEFPGIKVGSAAARKPGDPAYTKGTLHAQQRALDIQGLPAGTTIEEVLTFLENGLGLQLAQGHNGFWDETKRPATAKTWTGPHYHVGWDAAKTSRWQRATDAANNKDAKETQRLIEEGDRIALQTISANIQTVLDQAKNGSKSPVELKQDLDKQIAEYNKAALKQFDDAHPLAGLSDAQKKIIEADRAELLRNLAARSNDLHEKLYKQIEKTTEAALDSIYKSLKAALDAATQAADEAIAAQQARVDALGNRSNRNRFGAGISYIENRRLEDTTLQGDKAKLSATQTYAQGLQGLIGQQTDLMNSYQPGSQAYIDAQQKLIQFQQEYNSAMHDTVTLQEQINAQQTRLADIPLKDRLEGAAQAWMENSGAMDTWQKQAENFVGPALDQLSTGLSDFFTSVVTGQKSAAQALRDFLANFAQFVVEYIAKALALMAINALLKAMGVPVPGAMGGGGPAKDSINVTSGTSSWFNSHPIGSFNGGAVQIPGRFTGGVSFMDGGGRVMHGVSNRDSALYKLARDEYVVRGKSVKSLGIPFMDMINEHGAKGLAAMQGVQQSIVQAPHQEVNVWMVKEGTKPPVSKHDIVVAIADDILQGGQTKQLIKQVQNGG